MKLQSDNIYHIYNQGNNRQKIFFSDEDYLLFLKKYRELISGKCETLCYCLMPNHFHFLIYANEKSVLELKRGAIYIQFLSDGFRRLLSKYAHEINQKNGSIGSLFRQKTQAKLIDGRSESDNYSYMEQCFFYIHQNPVTAGLVEKNTDWQFSSARDYAGMRDGRICNKNFALKLFGWQCDELMFYNRQYIISNETKSKFFQPPAKSRIQDNVIKSDQGQIT
jgi:putative transposase